jgi:predicted ATPase/DNA-binding CsgD family transcriptional regulator
MPAAVGAWSAFRNGRGVGENRPVEQGWWPPGVSAREAEVLAGVAEHLTNAEIGARLSISTRTVESHVSSLLRKLGVRDRRALAGLAADLRSGPAADAGVGVPAARTRVWPSPLTSFIGRAAERAALAGALGEHRLVTAVGPGGVGKTRLAQVVAADMSDRYADGAWYVDLVPVTGQAMVGPAVAAALGLGEQQGRSAEDTVLGWLAGRDVLLVLDNCEHLMDGVVMLLERLLAGCPRLAVLATSRARLLVPYEWVFAVPGLSISGGGGLGDGVNLFLLRASAAGSTPAAADYGRVAAICRGLDGVALAIELAAARLPALGLDGLEAGLADRLQLLAGGRRIDDRHRSLRSALDWSFALLDGPSQAVLRRVSVFAAPFTAQDAVAVITDWPPVTDRSVTATLATLADQSLLEAVAGREATRYRALETIRQYASERLAEAGELADTHARHASWCLRVGAALSADTDTDTGGWRSAFDRIADELRWALGWAAARPECGPEAYRLAVCLAELSFVRGMPGESQHRYEQAADLSETDGAAAAALCCAAGAAAARNVGNDALRLYRAAADAALRAGDRAAAARNLAQAAEFINRCPGSIADLPPAEEVDALLAEARALAGADLSAEARIRTAEAFAGLELDPATADLTEQALALARRAADALTESAALDQLTSVQLARGEVRAAAASALQRTMLLAVLPVRADAGLELADAFFMAAETAAAAGDLPAARRLAERIRDLPFYREEGHLATAQLLIVTALAGDWDETAAFAEQYREGWERAGRPQAINLNRGAYAAATIHGLRGDDAARTAWIDLAGDLMTPGRTTPNTAYAEFFDALLLLHRGQHQQALQRLAAPPEQLHTWLNGLWRPWYAAMWAEAAVLTRHPGAASRIRRARLATAGNPIAAAVVDRAAALAGGDRPKVLATATALLAAGCRYQWARTLIFAGGEERDRGEAAMAGMGATPMRAVAADSHPG